MTAEQFSVLEEVESAASLQDLADMLAPAAVHQSAKARSAELGKAISQKDLDALNDVSARLSGIVAQVLANHIDLDNLGELTDEQLLDLMIELLDNKDSQRFFKVRYEMLREAIFAHMTAVQKAKGISEPEWAPAEVEVPKMGMKFVRQGGRAKNVIDMNQLRNQLGERWDQVCKAVVVPAVPEHIEYSLDEKKLLELVRDDPAVMEIVRECVMPAGRTSQALHTREL